MIGRLVVWFRMVLIAIDQAVHVLLAGPKFIIVGGPAPDPDETISSKVGRAAEKGKRWALLAERLIDAIMGAGHCRACIGT